MNETEIIDFLNSNQGKLFKISVITEEKLRTEKQVKYYWGVLVKIISDFTGYIPLEVNENNKILFGKTTFTGLSTVEFEAIMTLLRQFYNYHYNLNIPNPNEEF